MAARKETIYQMETEDGSMVRVPESRLEAWSEAQAKGRRELNSSEKLLKDRLVSALLGNR